MRYISTRGGMAPQTFSQILLGGLAPDGGLAIPERIPTVNAAELKYWRALNYRDLAFEIISKFVDDIPRDDLKALIDKSYTKAAFGSDQITPITMLEAGLYILECSNGPTLAFKDIAMQLLGNLFEYALEKNNEELNILGATSGDTGSSAEYAMRGKRGVRVFMLSPHKRMSAFQTAQMFSLQDKNIFNIAVRGVFDDCQDMVKAVSNDAAFKAKQKIGTVNSINWARVCAQTVYYFKAYFTVTRSNDEKIDVAVPSGNFGNIYAGYLARRMGLPIHHLILATNENNVLDEFFKTGVYRVRASSQVAQTSSPSMDISKASNFERFIFELVGRDADVVKKLWQQIDREGFFDLRNTPYFDALAKSGFISGSSTHQDRLETIREMYSRHGVVVDTHTADGIKVGKSHREIGVPLVCLETALPAKFAETIVEALGFEPPRPVGFDDLEKRAQRFEVMDVDTDAVKSYIAKSTGL
jgi:threonine synthase